MSADSLRRAAAILILILGGVALWWAGSGAPASASANDAMVATIAAARERAAANDPRLKPASRFEEGGWIYVHSKAIRARWDISTGTSWRRNRGWLRPR